MQHFKAVVLFYFLYNSAFSQSPSLLQVPFDSIQAIPEILIVSTTDNLQDAVTAHTTINKEYIKQNYGRDFSENLIVSPSVFNTRSGGGVGDSKSYIRGFGMADNGISLNDVPLEIPCGSYVYWSNWLNIGYYTNSISVYKGLPSGNGMQNSLGGTVMIQLEQADTLNELKVSSNYSISIGLTNGFKYNWSSKSHKTRATIGGNYSFGTEYFNYSKINGGTYFINVVSDVSKKYSIEFLAFGSPQTHWQRGSQINQDDYNKFGTRYNPDAGYSQGQLASTATNFFFRPFFLLTQSYKFSSRTKLELDVNYLHGEGGALRSFGNPIPKNQDGSLNFDSAYAINRSNTELITLCNGDSFTAKNSICYLGNFKNKHDRVGYNFSFIHSFSSKTSFVLNQYYYYQKEFNYAEVADLLGGDGVVDNSNPNIGTRFLKVGDRLWYNGIHTVHWRGLNVAFNRRFNKFSVYTFIEGMSMEHRNTEEFTLLVNGSNTSSTKNVWGGSTKMGIAYALTKSTAFFVNGAIMKRLPFTSAIYISPIQATAKPNGENVASVEAGWTIKKSRFQSSITMYYTHQQNVTRNYTLFDPSTATNINGNISGISKNHKGIELEITYTPNKWIQLGTSIGLSNFSYDKDVHAILKSPSGNPLDTVSLLINNLPVGNVPMNTYYVFMSLQPLKHTRMFVEYNGVGKYSSDFSIVSSDKSFKPWSIPAYQLFSISAMEIVTISNKTKLEFRIQVNNIFNVKYVQEAIDGSNHDAQSALVYYGLGRNYSIGLQIFFQ
jgi:Outer membrane receptor proteins, mostly Fe transport